MRILAILLSITAIANQLHAQTPVEPNDLVSLRESWNRARTSAVVPIDKKYEDALVAMKDRYTKQGNLQSAIAVDAAITRLKGGSTSAAAPAAVPPPPVAVVPATTKLTVKTKHDLEKFMEGTTWELTKNGKHWDDAEFRERGKLFYQKDRTWSATDKRKFTMAGYVATLSEDLTTFEVTWGETGALVGTLKKKQEKK